MEGSSSAIECPSPPEVLSMKLLIYQLGSKQAKRATIIDTSPNVGQTGHSNRHVSGRRPNSSLSSTRIQTILDTPASLARLDLSTLGSVADVAARADDSLLFLAAAILTSNEVNDDESIPSLSARDLTAGS
ncbi:unnamed protein product [Prunus brigantina]